MRTLIIDDEPDNARLLALQLKRYCPEVELIGQFTDSIQGLKAIQTMRPGLVFLDIEMPVMNGFQLLERLGEFSFHIVFVTAYDQYAVRAFRFCALDYLLKPVDTNDLVAAVHRARNTTRISPQQLEMLRLHHPWGGTDPGQAKSGKIALPHASGLVFVQAGQIVYCEADSNYTRFHLANKDQYMIAKTLGDVQEVLELREFIRVHRQYIVNLDHIQKLVRGEGTYLLMTNNVTIPVARAQKERLLERFGWV